MMTWDFRVMLAEVPRTAARLEAVAAQRRHDDEIAVGLSHSRESRTATDRH